MRGGNNLREIKSKRSLRQRDLCSLCSPNKRLPDSRKMSRKPPLKALGCALSFYLALDMRVRKEEKKASRTHQPTLSHCDLSDLFSLCLFFFFLIKWVV